MAVSITDVDSPKGVSPDQLPLNCGHNNKHGYFTIGYRVDVQIYSRKGALDFSRIKKAVGIEENDIGATVYTLRKLIMCLILQFMENLSHRHFERYSNSVNH